MDPQSAVETLRRACYASRVTDALRLLIDALQVALLVSLPLLLASFVVGALVALVQSATRLTEPSLNAIVRLLSALLVLSMSGPFMAGELSRFASELFRALPTLVR